MSARALALISVAVAALAGCGADRSGLCLAGREECDGVCIDTNADPQHCGGCAAEACPGDAPLCEGGACVAGCSTDRTECSGGCVDTETDPFHCGGCGEVCTLDQPYCVGGNCVASTGPDAGGSGIDANPACGAPPVPPGGACPGECTGGCQGTQCTIDCSGNNAPCDGANLVCPADFDCLVLCDGPDACDSGTIACPAGYGCRVECSGGNDACGDQQITCGDGPCSIDCAPDTCNGTQVDCGAGDCQSTCDGATIGDVPALDCTGACGCTPC